MTDRNKRKCRMCMQWGLQNTAVMVKNRRYPTLKQWYPKKLRKPSDWFHKQCLELLGMYPFPKDYTPLEILVKQKITSHIVTFAEANPMLRQAHEFICLAVQHLRTMLHISTVSARQQLRTLVCEWAAQHMGTSDEIVSVKLEELDADEYFIACGLCDDLSCHELSRRVESIAPHSVVPMKAFQRDELLRSVEEMLLLQSHVNIYLFDDVLYRTPESPGTLLTQEIVQKFGGDRVRIWSPNLKSDIVDQLKSLNDLGPVGWLTAGHGCWDTFNRQWDGHIRAAGGLDVVFADCFGGFVRGAGRLLEYFVKHRLFRERATIGDERFTKVMWAVSDLPYRMQGFSAASAVLEMVKHMQRIFDQRTDCPYVHTLTDDRSYGATMHYMSVNVHSREWLKAAPQGFCARVVQCET